MNAKTLTRLILIGGGATLAAITPNFLANGDEKKNDAPKDKSELRLEFNGDNSAAGQLGDLLKGLSQNLTDEQRQQLDKMLEGVRNGLKGAKPGEPKQFRFEFKSDGSGVKPADAKPTDAKPKSKSKAKIEPERDDNADNNPAQPDDLNGQMKRFQDQLRQQFQGGGLDKLFGDDFFKKFFQDLPQQFQQQPQGQGGQGPGANNLEQLLQQMGGDGSLQAHPKYARANGRAFAQFRPVIKDARDSVVSIQKITNDVSKQLALATIVSADGYAVTKASELGKDTEFDCIFNDWTVATAKVVNTVKDYDLALLKIDAKDLKPIQWNTAEDLPVGTFLAAVGLNENPIAIGVLSVPPRSLDSGHKGFLGIGMDGGDGGVKVTEVVENSAAAKAGLKTGDLVTAIDGRAVKAPKELTDYVTGKKAEDEVHVTYKRGDDEKTTVATLGSRDDRVRSIGMTETQMKEMMRQGDMTAQMGGKGNAVADGFPKALQNDLPIEINQCGGPILDLDGKAVGINIARAERTKTYAIPAFVLKGLLAKVSDGRLHEPKELSDLKREARKTSDELEEARKRLKDLEDKAKAAREALEKQGK